MKLNVSPYNNGALTWTEAEETAFRSYSITHQFNMPAKAKIVLDDPTGAILRKYNVDANDVFIGVGRVEIEDPTATSVFFGRILRAIPDSASRTVILECEDYMGQLADEEISYDMREKLSGNVRQSTAYADKDQTDHGYIDAAVAVITSAQQDNGWVFTDYTTESNAREVDDDVVLLPAVPAINDAFYFGFTEKTYEVFINFTTLGQYTGTCNLEYWDGGAWVALTYAYGGSNKESFKQTTGRTSYVCTIPADDWATVAVNGTTFCPLAASASNVVTSARFMSVAASHVFKAV